MRYCETIEDLLVFTFVFAILRKGLPSIMKGKFSMDFNSIMIQSICYGIAGIVLNEYKQMKAKKKVKN